MRALEAVMDGFQVMPMASAARVGDVFVTVTGNTSVIGREHIERMKDGAILANSGHFDVEIDVKGLKALAASVRRIRPSLDEYALRDGRKLYVAGEGRLVNLAAAEGHPSTVMAMSFCGQALACEYAVKHKGRMPIDVFALPAEIDEAIARLQLEALGVAIDAPTAEQKKYMENWREGT